MLKYFLVFSLICRIFKSFVGRDLEMFKKLQWFQKKVSAQWRIKETCLKTVTIFENKSHTSTLIINEGRNLKLELCRSTILCKLFAI